MIRSIRSLLFLPLISLMVLAAACSGDEGLKPNRVFEAPPWTGNETLNYQLVQQGGQVEGECVLETRTNAEPGRTQLSHLCGEVGGENRDDRLALVDSKTLMPVSSTRTILGSDGKRTTFTSAYSEREAQLTADVNGKVNRVTRTLPEASKEFPEPVWYDDETFFWLLRGITFRQGYETTYVNVNPGNARVFNVDVLVQAPEKITVPAGEFETWRVRVSTGSITQQFWIEKDAPHRVIKARIERVNYELTGGQ